MLYTRSGIFCSVCTEQFLYGTCEGGLVPKNGSNHLLYRIFVFFNNGSVEHGIMIVIDHYGVSQCMRGHWSLQVPNRDEPDSAGEMDYRYILQHLTECGYRGWVGLEYRPRAGTVDGLNWLRDWGYWS